MPPTFSLYTDPRYALHVPTGFHPERPARLEAALQGVRAAAPVANEPSGRSATEEEILRVHDGAFIDSLLRAFERGRGRVDPDTYFSEGSHVAAWWAAGSACAMVDELIDQPGRIGLLAPRPPGHHATRDRAMGFCLINHVAIAAAHARARGMERVAIVDWDVHHGNGTQDVFYRDPSVLFVSLHQFPHYPGTGSLGEHGTGDGTGSTINIPVPAGTVGATYAALFERVVLPVLAELRPQLVLISAGFDGHERDPLGDLRLDDRAFGWMAASLASLVRESERPRIGVVLEGGYDLRGLEGGVRSTVHGLLHGHAGDPVVVGRPEGEVDTAVVDLARRAHGRHWRVVT